MQGSIIFLILAVASSHAFHKSGPPSLSGAVALVTGGAKGIGFAICDNYLKNGAKTVIFIDINKPKGLEAEKVLRERHGLNRTVFIHADVTKQLNVVYKFIVAKFGCIDIFVNNAGILKESDPVLTMNTNALAPILWTEKFYELMRADRGSCKGGTIVMITSIISYMKYPSNPFYQCSKRALKALTFAKGHKWNYKSSKVRVYAIAPSLTYTDMTKNLVHDDKDVEILNKFRAKSLWQTADDVGRGAVILHKTAETGCMYTIEGGKPPYESPDRIDIVVNYELKTTKPIKTNQVLVLPVLKNKPKSPYGPCST